MLDAIIFDFDGVICESVEVKTEAFRKLFRDHPEHLERIIEFHTANGGMSRYEKFRVIYQDFLKCELTAEKSQELGRRFSEYSYDLVVKSEFVKGAHEFLNKYHRKLALFIASGTPQEEMAAIAKGRNLDRFFKGVYGSPRTKDALITTILCQGNFAAGKVVFVGDSINDYTGAQRAGVRFIGRVHAQFPDSFQGVHIERQIADLTELDEWVQKEMK